MARGHAPASVQASPCPLQAPGNEACESRGVKPKGCLNHPGAPGEGKIGRVNESELLMRLRQRRSPESVVYPFTAILGQQPGAEHSCQDARSAPDLVRGHQRPRRTGSTHPDRISLERNAAIPLWSGRKSRRPDELRKEGRIPQRAREGPRSEGRLPKGAGNP